MSSASDRQERDRQMDTDVKWMIVGTFGGNALVFGLLLLLGSLGVMG